MSKLTSTEQKILDRVRYHSERGALCGLGVQPGDPHYQSREFRFVKRLADSGAIVWVAWTPRLGAGWAISGSSFIPSVTPDSLTDDMIRAELELAKASKDKRMIDICCKALVPDGHQTATTRWDARERIAAAINDRARHRQP